MVEVQQVSSLPLPPIQFVSLYTEENIRRGRAPKPPPPFHDTYSMFGVSFHADDLIIRPLESQGIKRLYAQNFDHKRELKKLNHSILANFLDLIDILIRSPESAKREEKIEDLNLLFIHIHHLINEFRPHQARETLRVMMEVQKHERLETAERFNKHLDKAMETLQRALVATAADSGDGDCKLLVPTECFSKFALNTTDGATVEPCNLKDKLMCQIVDNLV